MAEFRTASTAKPAPVVDKKTIKHVKLNLDMFPHTPTKSSNDRGQRQPLCNTDDCNSLHGRMVGLTVPLTLLTSATQVIELSSVYKVNT
jgi:hypothetical protein